MKKETTMYDQEKAYKKNLGVKWVKANSGNTYLCPIGAFKAGDKPSEDQLRSQCVVESHNPQND